MLPTAPACSSVDVQDSYLFAFWSFHLYHKGTPLDSTPLEPRLSGKGKVLAPANMVKLNQLITEATSISWNCLFTIKASKSLKWDIWRTHQGQQQQRLLANLAWILTANMQLAKGIANSNHSKSSNYMQWWTQTQTISKRSHQLNPSPMASTS